MDNISLGLPYSTVHYGDTFVVTDRQGRIAGDRTGVYSRDTRYLNSYGLNLNGMAPVFLGMAQPYYFAQSLFYTNQAISAGPRIIPENTLLLHITRYVSSGVHEDIVLTNYAGAEIEISMTLNLSTDFADIFQVRDLARLVPRIAEVEWDNKQQRVVFHYRNGEFTRSLFFHVHDTSSPPIRSVNTIIFPLKLGQGQTWQTCVDIYFEESESTGHLGAGELLVLAEESRNWQSITAHIETPARQVRDTYDQAITDLGSLRLEKVNGSWFPAAGLPWFAAVFGRDSLIVALQAITVYCPFAIGVLERLAQLQGTQVNPKTEEEPGKIGHELRKGELTSTGKLPYTPYYGTVDASLLFVILLHEAFRFTGDLRLLERFNRVAVSCLEWAYRYGDFDEDGFIEYRPMSPQGYRNQGWKDSSEAVVYPDGAIVAPPIAICEVQGYYYDSLLRMSEVARLTGQEGMATTLLTRAETLYGKFNDQFWIESESTYAFGLDSKKRPIATVASNAGHLLWSGIVPRERAPRLASRLMAEDMFSGWGIRTLSSENPAFDPISYQQGSVWPHDNAIIAMGLKRYGFWQEANRIAEGIFNVAASYGQSSLPEVFSGVTRSPLVAPVPYAQANLPQAWAAGSIFMLLRAILGLESDPQGERLLVTPTLPEWLPEFTLRNLTILDSRVDLRFAGRGLESSVEATLLNGTVKVEQRDLQILQG